MPSSDARQEYTNCDIETVGNHDDLLRALPSAVKSGDRDARPQHRLVIASVALSLRESSKQTR